MEIIGELFLEVADFGGKKKALEEEEGTWKKKKKEEEGIHSRWRLPAGGLLGEFGDGVYLIWPAECLCN